jgi:hypothetical protein
MINLLYLFLVIVGLKLLINLSKYIQCKRYRDKYFLWLAGSKKELLLVEHKSQVIKLFKDAGVKDNVVGVAQPLGYGQIQVGGTSVFANFPHRREDIVKFTFNMFGEAIGVYRSRTLEAFNPLYWIEFIINLPKHSLSYLGVSPESVVIKIFQLIYWIAGVVVGFLFALYRPEIEKLVRDFISKLPTP